MKKICSYSPTIRHTEWNDNNDLHQIQTDHVKETVGSVIMQ